MKDYGTFWQAGASPPTHTHISSQDNEKQENKSDAAEKGIVDKSLIHTDTKIHNNEIEPNATLIDRRIYDVTSQEIQQAIIDALSECPNHSCTLDSLTSRVLKVIGVLTRGKPRKTFERRMMHCVKKLEQLHKIEQYKAKNLRVRLMSELNK